jgi:alpha-galactosidase
MAQAAIGQVLGLPVDEIDPKAGGLNHFNWIVDLRRASTGEDLYDDFKAAMTTEPVEKVGEHGYHWGIKLCHYLMDVFGYFPLPSDDHVGEYLSYAWEFCGLEGYDFAAADANAVERRAKLERVGAGQEAPNSLLSHASGERAIPIIAGVLGNTHQHELAVNVPNQELIPNLPPWAIVEVPAVIDATGVHGLPIGPLPEPIAAMCRTQVAVIDRVVEAGVHGDPSAALAALLLDPVLSSRAQAEAILDELLAVHADLLPQFRQ